MVRYPGAEAAIGEGAQPVVAEHHVDAEPREAAVEGGADAAPLVAVGVVQVVGEACVEPRSRDVVHIPRHDERHRALGHHRPQLLLPLGGVLQHGALGLVQGGAGEAVHVAVLRLLDALAVGEAEVERVHVHAAQAYGLLAGEQLDDDFLRVDALDVGEGQAREDGRPLGLVGVAARAVVVVVAHEQQAVGGLHVGRLYIFLQAEHVGPLPAHEVEELQREGVLGLGVELRACEVVHVPREEGDARGVLLEGRRRGRAAQLA